MMHSEDELDTNEEAIGTEPMVDEPAADDSPEDSPEDSLEDSPEDSPEEEVPVVGGGARLVLKRSGAETDVVFPLTPPSTIGRFDPDVGPIDVDLGTIDEGVYVSRKHAQIVCEDDVWKLRDLGSSNGTFVLRADFERIEEADLADGDEVAFGNARFVFRF